MLACAGASLRQIVPNSKVPLVSRQYTPLDTPVRNPERGFVQFVQMNEPGDIAYVKSLGVSLANVRVRLDAYLDEPIDRAFLAKLERGFARIRDAGLKLVLRFQYNIGSGKDPNPKRVLSHIDQLTPLLRRNADIIAVLQAGFIGAWGEWHTSISGLTARKHQAAVLARLLSALPADRSIQLRSPAFKRALAGKAVTENLAHTSAPRARLGHHNDCLLSGPHDSGTYPEPVDVWRAYTAADSKFVPVGGETCAVNPPRTDCARAVAELRRFHYSYLNRAYHPDVLRAWRTQGCAREIERDLGYRLVLRRARWSAYASPGGSAYLELELENRGYAAPFNRRPVYLVIEQGSRRYATELAGVDIRRWLPGQVRHLRLVVDIPGDLEPGTHLLSLWLPDAAPSLRFRPSYAIRFANADMWRPALGSNLLGELRIIDGG